MVLRFFTQFERMENAQRFRTRSGDGLGRNFVRVVNELGDRTFKEIAPTDLYQQIQSHRSSVDLPILLERYRRREIDPITMSSLMTAGGDGAYLDTTQMPRTYAEVFERAERARLFFDRLPADVKSDFGNSYVKFWSTFGSPEFNNVMSRYSSQASGDSVENVAKDGVSVEQKSE